MDAIKHSTETRRERKLSLLAPLGQAALFSAIALAVVLTAWLAVSAFAPPASVAAPQPADTSYEQIEHMRGNVFAPVSGDDGSIDEVERLRGRIVLPAAPTDTSYDQVERLRGGITGG